MPGVLTRSRLARGALGYPGRVIRALVFDFDGLILDTELASLRAWQEAFAEHGCELPLARWASGIGRGAGDKEWDPCDELERALGQALERAAFHERRRAARSTLAR